MRIISGSFKGRKLNTLEGDNTRPTADKVKCAIFNILGNTFYDLSVLDLFGGSGALGIESVSRGATKCTIVDASKYAIKIIKSNVALCKAEELIDVVECDFEKAILRFKDKEFDLVFLDPPYGKDMGIKALEKLDRVTKDTVTVVLETDFVDEVPNKIGAFEKHDTRKYGRTVVSFFGKEGFIHGGS